MPSKKLQNQKTPKQTCTLEIRDYRLKIIGLDFIMIVLVPAAFIWLFLSGRQDLVMNNSSISILFAVLSVAPIAWKIFMSKLYQVESESNKKKAVSEGTQVDAKVVDLYWKRVGFGKTSRLVFHYVVEYEDPSIMSIKRLESQVFQESPAVLKTDLPLDTTAYIYNDKAYIYELRNVPVERTSKRSGLKTIFCIIMTLCFYAAVAFFALGNNTAALISVGVLIFVVIYYVAMFSRQRKTSL